MKKFAQILLLTGLFGLWLAPFQPGRAAEGETTFAWGITASLNNRPQGLFFPPQVDDIYLLANQTHVLSGKQTYVYYWPLDREYKADWSRLNKDVAGTLEVLNKNGTVLQEIAPSWYVWQQTLDEQGAAFQLVAGEAAPAAYTAYQNRRQAYYALVRQYDQALQVYLETVAQGHTPQPAPPQAPPPFAEIMQEPQQAFLLNLPAGSYQVRLRDAAGAVVPASQHRLISVAPRQAGVGYVVIPAARWTEPENAFAVQQTIYAADADDGVYLQPVRTWEYNAREYARLTQPQEKTSAAQRWTWISGFPLTDHELALSPDRAPSQRLQLEAFHVQQTTGSALGYQIVPAANGDAADFTAYKLVLDPSVARYRIRLVTEAGAVVDGSEREVVLPRPQLPNWVLVFPLLPIVFSIGLRAWRTARHKQNDRILVQNEV